MKKSIGYWVAFSLNLFCCEATLAKDALSNEKVPLFHEELLFGVIPSVFSASKYEQKLTEAPARISIITADEIERFGHRTLVDVLNTVPGFQTSSDSSYSSVGARGFAVLGDYNTRILVLVDGHRMNENIFDGVLIDHGFILDIDLLDRIEIVRGPASSLYGSNALLGVINVITKRGRDIQGVAVSGSSASNSSHQAGISYGQRFDNGFEMLLSASGYKSKGNERIYYAEFDDPSTNNGIAENADASDSRGIFANFSFEGFKLSAAYLKYEKAIPTASYDAVFNDSRTRIWETSAFVDLKYQKLLNNGIEMTARLYYDERHYTGDWAFDYAGEGKPSDIIISTEKSKGAWWGTEMSMTRQFLDNHRMTLGAEYQESLSARQYNYNIYGHYLDINPQSDSFAIFVQDNFQLLDNLILNIGVRHDSFSNSISTTNPRLAVIWEPGESTTFKLIYGAAFRAPNSYELQFHDNGVSQKAPDGLKPETIKTAEFIAERRLSEYLNLVVSLYENDIDNLIALVTDPSDALLVFSNNDKVIAKGVELELQGEWHNGWSSSVSYSYQDSKYASGEFLPNTAKNMAKFSLVTPRGHSGLSAALTIHYEDGRPLIYGGKTAPSSISNLTLTHNGLVQGVAITAGIYNLFDKDYAIPAGEEHYQQQLKRDGRTFRLKFSYSY